MGIDNLLSKQRIVIHSAYCAVYFFHLSMSRNDYTIISRMHFLGRGLVSLCSPHTQLLSSTLPHPNFSTAFLSATSTSGMSRQLQESSLLHCLHLAYRNQTFLPPPPQPQLLFRFEACPQFSPVPCSSVTSGRLGLSSLYIAYITQCSVALVILPPDLVWKKHLLGLLPKTWRELRMDSKGALSPNFSAKVAWKPNDWCSPSQAEFLLPFCSLSCIGTLTFKIEYLVLFNCSQTWNYWQNCLQ